MTAIDKLLNKFKEIRDIKYQIPLTRLDIDYCCSGKMKLFKKWLDDNNYISRYRVCDFKWSDMNLPQKLFNIPHQNESTHVYLEIYINNQWIDTDPTWDIGLKNILPVNDWDGKTNCKIAVPVINKYSDSQSEEIMNGIFDEQDAQANGDFYQAFNNYLKENRIF
ncbi:MAG: hypothetical protein PHP35_02000 [Candidatus Colwellbacteria bacterium]|nr:hypothetical protein [Candidatus Colwellbacteria bacterium]